MKKPPRHGRHGFRIVDDKQVISRVLLFIIYGLVPMTALFYHVAILLLVLASRTVSMYLFEVMRSDGYVSEFKK